MSKDDAPDTERDPDIQNRIVAWYENTLERTSDNPAVIISRVHKDDRMPAPQNWPGMDPLPMPPLNPCSRDSYRCTLEEK